MAVRSIPQCLAAMLLPVGACGAASTAFLLPQQGASLGARPAAAPEALRAGAWGSQARAVPGAARTVTLWAQGAVLLGALVAAGQRRRQPRGSGVTTRRVALRDIQSISINDIPAGWRPRISLPMARRDDMVQVIKRKLEDTFFIMAWNRDKLDPKELDAAREMFPESVLVRGLKNSLVKKAMEGTGWEAFSSILKGNNMYVFVMQDSDVKPTINAYIKMERKFRRKDVVAAVYEKVAATQKFRMTPVVGGCIRGEWQAILPEDIPKLKDFVTKIDLIARIAGGIKQVPTKLARSTKQVSQKIAIGTKKIVEKMEEQGKSKVGDVVA